MNVLLGETVTITYLTSGRYPFGYLPFFYLIQFIVSAKLTGVSIVISIISLKAKSCQLLDNWHDTKDKDIVSYL